MEIKKKSNGYEVDGIVFNTKDLANRYLESLMSKDAVIADTDWLDETIDYSFDSEQPNPSFNVFMENIVQTQGLNLKQAAEKIGVSRQTLYNWMDAKVIPDPASVEKICQAFEVKKLDVELAYRDNVAKTFPEIFQIMVLEPNDCRILIETLSGLVSASAGDSRLKAIIDKVQLIEDLASPSKKRKPKRA